MWFGRISLIALAAVYIALTTKSATPESWVGFYSPSPAVSRTSDAHQAGHNCIRHILDAQRRYGIPDNLLLAIGIQEAGRTINSRLTIWPWTANSHGTGAFFDSKANLESWVREKQAQGRSSIDVGCMQINQKWHARHFASLEEATDPASNVDYAARFLVRLHHETADWWEAAGRYHSSTPAVKETYLAALRQNHKLAMAGAANMAPVDLVAEAVPQPSINWSSVMSGVARNGSAPGISIYSNRPLQPILPNYEAVN